LAELNPLAGLRVYSPQQKGRVGKWKRKRRRERGELENLRKIVKKEGIKEREGEWGENRGREKGMEGGDEFEAGLDFRFGVIEVLGCHSMKW